MVLATVSRTQPCRDAAADSEVARVFLVSQRRGPAQLLAMATDLSKQFQVPLVAWGAVAADVSPSLRAQAGSTGTSLQQQQQGIQAGPGEAGQGSEPGVAVVGRAFCFLPLPALTGLPVHINGFFELSSNR